jgi:GNAT superfamily N-acetyltransferase
MSNFEFELDLDPKQSSLDILIAGLNAHSQGFFEKTGFRPIALFARDESDHVKGGIYSRINWNWVDVSLLWVSPESRGSGLGSTLLKRLESEALDLGCTKSHVDTFSFQARAFYLANGYSVFAELAEYPDGHSRIYMHKSLTAAPE